MTAEIAILNKMAVALAADSAVTISVGEREEKIFNSADKLFELSDRDPIGIMIYNGMSFMEVPLPSLIRQFRSQVGRMSTVADTSEEFLRFLDEVGRKAPEAIKDAALRVIVVPLLSKTRDDALAKFYQRISSLKDEQERIGFDANAEIAKFLTETLSSQKSVLSERATALFVGVSEGNSIEISDRAKSIIEEAIKSTLPMATPEQVILANEVIQLAIERNILSRNRTGIVIAGLGANELFPTLLSFEIDGILCDHLKYNITNHVDIDRLGTRAKVIPFAQREMVERFLYGLDEESQGQIGNYAASTITSIQTEMFKLIDISDAEGKAQVEAELIAAERAFIEGLHNNAFTQLRNESQKEIEDMVEFMPKPELAKMAEALVNLTSIKRRVSRGMETVGGPIDVAIISQSEGFVWIKRKHYFPAELNPRYAERVRVLSTKRQEESDGRGSTEPRQAGKTGRGRAPAKGRQHNGFGGDALRSGGDADGNSRSIPESE